MRVLVLTIVHVPRDARIFEREIAALRGAGIDVTYGAPWSACDDEPPPDLATIDVPRAAGRSRWRGLRKATAVLRNQASQFDLVIIHDPELLLAVALVRPDVPVVWDVHEDTAAALVARAWLPGFLRPLARASVRLMERWAERRLHLVLAEHAYRERFRQDHPVVPNVPVVPKEAPPPGADRVVYVGRVAQARGAAELVAVGRALRGEVIVEVVGDAEPAVADQLAAAARDGDIDWRGFLPNRDALERVTGALAGLSLLHDLPNFRGSMPTKVLEYMACGVPVITTPLPLAADVVRRADAGVVVPFQDVPAVAAAIRMLRSDPEGRSAAGLRARALVEREYSWQREAPQYVELLRGWSRGGGP